MLGAKARVSDKLGKWNESSQYKSTSAIFSSSLPICPHPYFLKWHPGKFCTRDLTWDGIKHGMIWYRHLLILWKAKQLCYKCWTDQVISSFPFSCVFITQSIWRKIVVYVEGTLYPWVFILKIGRHIMPISWGCIRRNLVHFDHHFATTMRLLSSYYICNYDFCSPMCPCSCKYISLYLRLNDGSNQLLVKYVIAWYDNKSFRSKCTWNFDIFCSSLIYPLFDDNWISWWQV